MSNNLKSNPTVMRKITRLNEARKNLIVCDPKKIKKSSRDKFGKDDGKYIKVGGISIF